MRLRALKNPVLTCIVAIALAGCATIIHHGGKQRILISSNPTGATATIDGLLKVETPGEVKLKRGRTHVVVIEKEGYETAQVIVDHDLSGWVFGNILLGGLIGLVVDFSTGGAWNLEPETVAATLRPVKTESTPRP